MVTNSNRHKQIKDSLTLISVLLLDKETRTGGVACLSPNFLRLLPVRVGDDRARLKANRLRSIAACSEGDLVLALSFDCSRG